MAAPDKRVRTKEVGFIGVKLVKDGDMTIFNRLEQEVKSDPEMDRSRLIRIALKEYFERKDSKNG